MPHDKTIRTDKFEALIMEESPPFPKLDFLIDFLRLNWFQDARNATELEAVMEKQKMKVDLKSQATTTTL